MDGLVGYTGFVGGNLLRQHAFGGLFNRANVASIGEGAFDRLVVSAVPATMWLANRNPEADRAGILDLFRRLERTEVRQLILVSTIAVYRDVSNAPDEQSRDFETERAYGRNRRELEALVEEAFPNHLVLRLPALFGHGLRKNFLFDLLHPVPSFLSSDLFAQLRGVAAVEDTTLLAEAFTWDDDASMWALARKKIENGPEAPRLEALCAAAGISALAFTHADSTFQFYDLSRLWSDIECALAAGVSSLNLATEPVSAGDIHGHLLGKPMDYRSASRVAQDMRTRHAGLWGRGDGYLADRDEVVRAIRSFVDEGG